MDFDVRPYFVLAVRLEVAEIAGVLCQLEMLGFYVEVQVIVALQKSLLNFMLELVDIPLP